jgi:hypothetical protein
MRELRWVLTIWLLLAATALAAAVDSNEPQATAPAAVAADADDDKVICKTERVVGSNIPKRTCTTQRQLREIRESSQRALHELQRETTRTAGGEGS